MQTIQDIMTRDVQTISPQETVQRAAQMMDELNVGALPVCDGDRLVGMVTDYDCWREGEEAVEVSAIVAQLMKNAETGRRLVEALARALPPERSPSPIDTALDTALITAPAARDPAMLARLDAVCRRVLAR